MTTLRIHLNQVETEVLDEIMTGTLGFRRDDSRRGDAMSTILLRYHQMLGERKDRKAEVHAAQQAFRDRLDVVLRERDAVRRRWRPSAPPAAVTASGTPGSATPARRAERAPASG